MKPILFAGLGIMAVAILVSSDTVAAPHETRNHRAAAAAAASPLYDYAPPAAGSYKLPVIKNAADGRILDEQGNPRSLRALLADRITVLGFVYTRCRDPQGCPLIMSTFYHLYDLARHDPDLHGRFQLATLSFDPAHDTPPVMAEQAEAFRDGGKHAPPWHFLTTAGQADLQPILDAYDQPLGRKTDLLDPSGPFNHMLRVFLVDPAGRIRNIYSFGFLDPRLVIADVRTLLMASRSTAHRR